jgi:hypothetical protein
MSVLILDQSAWREFRGVPPSQGINPTTHLARIADPAGKLHDCFVKLLSPRTPALLCEALGWMLAQASDVPSPKFGAIVLLPLAGLRKQVALPPVYDGMAVCPAWCSEVVAGDTVKQVHKMSFMIAQGNCLRSKDARKIAAFDKWTDVRDRHFGNVIRAAEGGYVAIDHETLLHDTLWVGVGSWGEHSLLIEAQKRLTPKEFKRFRADMELAAKGHAKALVDATAAISDLIGKLFPAEAVAKTAKVMDVLSERSKAGWLTATLGVTA